MGVTTPITTSMTMPGWMYDPFVPQAARVPEPGNSLKSVIEYLMYIERAQGRIDDRGLLGICKSMAVIIETQNEKIEELEGMLFDHIEDESDLYGDNS